MQEATLVFFEEWTKIRQVLHPNLHRPPRPDAFTNDHALFTLILEAFNLSED